MDNKYYTPTIDEFRVGFEFEWYDEDDKTWNKTIIKTQSELYNWTAFDDINKRVKYLDKNDIESLGFIYNKTQPGLNEDYFEYNSVEYYMDYDYTRKYCRIYFSVLDGDSTIFAGIIKNKSELIVLLKQLDI